MLKTILILILLAGSLLLLSACAPWGPWCGYGPGPYSYWGHGGHHAESYGYGHHRY
ncbi:hypothetical protein [Pelobacter seleniigenes]|uniref:hypothetical protein n=1 Tax=Pelobacter seleniigenes TaxID=407188 RepID=UPI0012B6DD01|nr:hypothetical protein [Pelobacter seleniigenes]